MGSQEVSESVRVSNNSVTSCGDGLEQLGSGNLGVDILEDLDSYWEDINDRLMISRMVSDSVIKGMVNAVEQQEAERLAVKELELAGLKESLQFFHVGTNKTRHEPESLNYAQHLSRADACVEHDRMSESLSNMGNDAREQFKRLKQEIDEIRGSSSLRRIGSGCELIGLGGILKEKETENWVGLDRTVDGLKMTMDTICTQVDDILAFSKASRQEEEYQREVEAIVMQSSIRTLQEELEEKLWDQKARFCGSQTVNWVEKFDEISNLRKELDAILKLLPNPESGQLISYGSCDTDHSLRMTFGNHTSFTPSLWEGSGKIDESKTGVPENFDAAQFNHMTNKELVNFFNIQITKMKRDHESTVQQMTEEYISLKGKYLNQRGSSLPLRRDKEFDMLKKKIPDVILKLDDIIGENEKLPAFSENVECLGSLKERLDSLLLENRQLRDSLTDKKNEVRCLSSQVIDAAEKKMQHSSAEANMLKSATHLNSIMEDALMEALVRDEVNKCVLRELSDQIRTKAEESKMEFIIMQEIFGIIYGESAHKNETTVKCEIEDSDMESMIMQEICGIIFRESIKGAEGHCEELYKEYLVERGHRVSLEMEVLEKEKKIRLEVEEKEGSKQEVLFLKEEKEQLLTKMSAALMKEKEQFDLASLKINELRDQTKRQEMLISESNKELDVVKGKLGEALEQIEVDEMEVNFLHQKLELVLKDLKEADEQRNMFIALTQEKQNDLSLFKAKEKEHCKQMEAVIVLVEGLSKKLSNFECRVAELIKSNSTRLEHSRSQLSSLINKANILSKTGLMYKQSLERRSSDLQMAEAEVDLLGDEVEALLSLLEKIYIALDHYSPILQHYPGIIEILKLVRRELSEAPTKAI